MSILTALTNKYSLEEAFAAKDCTTQEMRDAIKEWFFLYYNKVATKGSDPCQRIAYTVVNKLTKTCFGEYKAESKDEFVRGIIDALDDRKRKAMQMLLVGGENFLKPVPTADGWVFRVVRRDNVLVFGRDASGTPTDIGTAERTAQGNKFYTLLERRTVDAQGRLTIRNKLFCSLDVGFLGQPVPLKSLEQYAALVPEYTYPTPLGGLGLVYMKVPIENTVDGSDDGVAVYDAAVGLIHNIDINEAQINGEFDRGESKVFASADLMKRDKDGKRRFEDNVFVALDDAPENVGVTIFSPALREQSFLNRKREYLRNVETIIGIKRGLLSEVEAAERTAKEVTSSEGDYNLTITDLQEVWTNAVHDALKLCGVLGKLYKVKGAHDIPEPEGIVTIDWGNGVLFDEEKTWADYMAMVAAGMLKPEVALGWKFGMPTETEKDLTAIREKFMPATESMTADLPGESGPLPPKAKKKAEAEEAPDDEEEDEGAVE